MARFRCRGCVGAVPWPNVGTVWLGAPWQAWVSACWGECSVIWEPLGAERACGTRANRGSASRVVCGFVVRAARSFVAKCRNRVVGDAVAGVVFGVSG